MIPSSTQKTGTSELVSDRPSEAHVTEWVEGSVVDETIARLAIESLTADELNERIKPGTPIKTGGWWVRGVNWRTGEPMGNRYGQGKPDKPHQRSDGKTAKYMTASGMEPDAVFLPMPDKDYWLNVYSDKNLIRNWTEGVKKAGAGLSTDSPTIAVTGVWNWSKDKQLAPDVKKWAQPGTHHVLSFDSDYVEKEGCRAAISTFARLLKAEGVASVKIAVWDKQWKGMDDYIKANGKEAFKKIIDTAKTVSQWEKQFKTNDSNDSKQAKKTELPAADKTAATLAERYKNELAWESEYQLWRHYGAQHDGMWSEETPESVKGIVHAHLRCLEGQPDFGAGSVSSVVTILQSDLEVKELNEQKGLLPLRDGVLDLETMQLKPHSPGYRFTWQLPFKWADRGVGCKPIEEFLLKITGNEQIAEVLLCYLAAIVTRRSDLQRYLELIGGGGTGKSTFMALAKALAGDENAVSSQLHLLEKNQFETSRFYRKLLVLFPDSERWQGGVSVLKQLTGQDPVRYEQKNIQQSTDYVYEGMVILSANEAPESNDRTSGQERRKLTIGLDNRIPEYEGRELAEEFKQYLPGLLKRVLEIPRERVTALIKHTEKNVPALAEKKWAQLIETNPIAGWLDECLILSPQAKSYIGKDNPEESARWLYANFCKHQRESGHRTLLPVKRFSSNLRDLLKNQMKVSVQEGRDRNGSYITGVGLRCFYDPKGTDYQRPITKGDCDNILEECDGFEEKCDGFVTDETLTSVGCDGCDGFLENPEIIEKNQEIAASEKDSCVGEFEENPSHSTHLAPVSIPTVTNPSQEKANPSQPLPDDELLGWETYHNHKPYPHPNSANVRSSQKRALAIREAWRTAKTKEELSALRSDNGGKFSEKELIWVSSWLKNFFPSEYNQMLTTAKISQPNLL